MLHIHVSQDFSLGLELRGQLLVHFQQLGKVLGPLADLVAHFRVDFGQYDPVAVANFKDSTHMWCALSSCRMIVQKEARLAFRSTKTFMLLGEKQSEPFGPR